LKVTGYSVKVNGIETDLSLISKSIILETKSIITTNYNVTGYGESSICYNTLYTVNVDGV